MRGRDSRNVMKQKVFRADIVKLSLFRIGSSVRWERLGEGRIAIFGRDTTRWPTIRIAALGRSCQWRGDGARI